MKLFKNIFVLIIALFTMSTVALAAEPPVKADGSCYTAEELDDPNLVIDYSMTRSYLASLNQNSYIVTEVPKVPMTAPAQSEAAEETDIGPAIYVRPDDNAVVTVDNSGVETTIGYMVDGKQVSVEDYQAMTEKELGCALQLRDDGAIVCTCDGAEKVIGYHVNGKDYSVEEYESMNAESGNATKIGPAIARFYGKHTVTADGTGEVRIDGNPYTEQDNPALFHHLKTMSCTPVVDKLGAVICTCDATETVIGYEDQHGNFYGVSTHEHFKKIAGLENAETHMALEVLEDEAESYYIMFGDYCFAQYNGTSIGYLVRLLNDFVGLNSKYTERYFSTDWIYQTAKMTEGMTEPMVDIDVDNKIVTFVVDSSIEESFSHWTIMRMMRDVMLAK